MSKLPSYLERGDKQQENALNFGVLDWCRLEQWQNNQKMLHRRSGSQTIAVNGSHSVCTSKGSNIHSNGGKVCCTSRQTRNRPTLQYHLMSSSADFHKNGSKTNVVANGELLGLGTNIVRNEADNFSGKPASRSCSPSRSLGMNSAALVQMKAKVKSRVDDFVQKRSKVPIAETGASERNEKVIHIDKAEQFSVEFGSRAVSVASSSGSNVPSSSYFTQSETQFHALESSKSKFRLPVESQCVSNPFPKLANSYGNTEANSSLHVRNSYAVQPLASSKTAAEKRSTSPFRRIGIGMSKISKSFGSKEGFSTTHSADYASSRSDIEVSAAPVYNDNPRNKGRSSPLRRLIDPLLKPKAPAAHQHEKSHSRDLSSSDSVCRVKHARMPQELEQPVTNVFVDKRNIASPSQALLRVTEKNGQPLFTFAVDNEPEILAATIKKLSSSTTIDNYSCMYTFFSIQEVKKKNGRWINQGDRSKSHDYVQNVVGKLKVSSSHFSRINENGLIELSFSRQFVLLDVELRNSDEHMLDFQPNNELAAVVLKIPKVIHKTPSSKLHENGREHCLVMNSQSPVQNLFNATVVLPNGVHSLPSKGGPSSLIQRWKTGGSCDCGGWDMSCKLNILSNWRKSNLRSCSSPYAYPDNKFELFVQGADEDQSSVFSMSPFKDGIYSVEFNSLFTIMQAFTVCIAVLDANKLVEDSRSSTVEEGKPLNR